MKNEKIGLIGFGAIGQEVYKKILRKTINGYKAIARKGKTAQEVFISTELSKDKLKEIIDLYNKK